MHLTFDRPFTLPAAEMRVAHLQTRNTSCKGADRPRPAFFFFLEKLE